MKNTSNYIFTSERLGFRTWESSDIPKLFAINSNLRVMEFFPSLPTLKETEAFVERMNTQYIQSKFCYFAVDCLESGEFIGFVGLSKQTYESDFTPCIDIGWRLDEKFWYKGYATEGARASLNYAFNTLQLNDVVAVCPKVNFKSEQVMKKIGMYKRYEFKHTYLKNNPVLELCVLYGIDSRSFTDQNP